MSKSADIALGMGKQEKCDHMSNDFLYQDIKADQAYQYDQDDHNNQDHQKDQDDQEYLDIQGYQENQGNQGNQSQTLNDLRKF